MQRIVIFILIGLAIGVAVGLIIGWQVAPVQVTDGRLSDLLDTYRDDYTVMVAAGYQVDCDQLEALNRLSKLGVPNIPLYVRDVTERFLSERGSGNEQDIRNLIKLSRDMGYYTAPMQTLVPQSAPCVPKQPGS